jgi:4-oxalocrotonate tautomerase
MRVAGDDRLPGVAGRCHNPASRRASTAAARSEPRSTREDDPMPNITIQWYAGRTDQQRRDITAAITEAMVKIGKTTADQVHIVFQDVEKSHWGVGGKLASD